MKDKFAEMAKRVASENATRQADNKLKSDEARVAKDARIDADIAALEQHVRPVLLAAQEAFKGQGLTFVISENYDVRNRAVYVSPNLVFHGQTPARESDGYRGDTRPVFFASEDKALKVSAGEHSVSSAGDGKHLGTTQIEHADELVTKGVEWTLSAYHEDVENAHWLFLRR